MSPNNKKKLDLIRVKLDKLDNKLLSLIKYRTKLVEEVLKLKEFKKEIVDKKRINFILKKIKSKSLKQGIDYLLCGGSFFSTNISCFLVSGLYFFADNFTFAFSPPAGFFT
jgi:chorismate mutase